MKKMIVIGMVLMMMLTGCSNEEKAVSKMTTTENIQVENIQVEHVYTENVYTENIYPG